MENKSKFKINEMVRYIGPDNCVYYRYENEIFIEHQNFKNGRDYKIKDISYSSKFGYLLLMDNAICK